jgi:hypothetical protein
LEDKEISGQRKIVKREENPCEKFQESNELLKTHDIEPLALLTRLVSGDDQQPAEPELLEHLHTSGLAHVVTRMAVGLADVASQILYRPVDEEVGQEV